MIEKYQTCPDIVFLEKLDDLLEEYVEISPYAAIFEAAAPEVGAATANNIQIEKKTMNIFQRATAVIRKIFQNIATILNSISKWFKMDKEQKKGYDDFVREAKSNPEFANATITLHDYRKITAEYEKILSNAEKEYQEFKKTEAEERPSLQKDLQETLTKKKNQLTQIAKSSGSRFTVATALNYAKANRENAVKVRMALAFDMGLLDQLEKEMSKGEIRRFKRKVRHLSSRNHALRIIAGGRQEQVRTLQEAIGETMKQISKVGTIAGILVHDKNIREIAKNVAQDVGDVAHDSIVGGKNLNKDYAKNAYRSLQYTNRKSLQYNKKKIRGEVTMI